MHFYVSDSCSISQLSLCLLYIFSLSPVPPICCSVFILPYSCILPSLYPCPPVPLPTCTLAHLYLSPPVPLPNPANAAALLKQEGAATSAGGVWMLSPGVRMPPPCSGVGLDQRWGWSNDQCPQRNFPLPEPTELPSTTLEHGDEGDGQLCAKRSID